MDQPRAIRSFVEIADPGSLTRAADNLDLSRARVSRHVERLDRWLGARLLHCTTRRMSAAPGHPGARGTPARPADLAADQCITHAFGTRAKYRLGPAGRMVTQVVHGPLSGNETAEVEQAAIAGAGIAMLPTCFVGDALRRGTLARVLPA